MSMRAIEAILNDDYLCLCPYCEGGKLALATDDQGEPKGLVHSFPRCDRHVELGVEGCLADVTSREETFA
jgi:hypothetical protein